MIDEIVISLVIAGAIVVACFVCRILVEDHPLGKPSSPPDRHHERNGIGNSGTDRHEEGS